MRGANHENPAWIANIARRASEQSTFADAAANYAACGVPVFPCVPGGKRPLTSRGFHDATMSATTVREWWRRTPGANIGIPTGSVSGVVVVDVDVHGTETGYPAFGRAGDAELVKGWSLLVRTPSGGLHAYFPTDPAGPEQRCWQSARTHVDFRGDGGYIVAPPSRVVVDGVPQSYDVIAVARHERRPLDSNGLRQFLDPPRPIPRSPSVPAPGARPDRLAAWVASRPEGARNQGLFWAACRMVEDGHPLSSTLSILGDAAGQAGLPDQEAERTIRSAHRIAGQLSATTSTGPTSQSRGVSL